MNKTINLNLERDDLISLVKGTSPSYSIVTEMQNLKLGTLWGGMGGESWEWGDLSLLDLEELYALYLKCKNSWKK